MCSFGCMTLHREPSLTIIRAIFNGLYLMNLQGVRIAQFEEAWTVNCVVGRSSPSWDKLSKSLQQSFNPKIAQTFGLRRRLGGAVDHNNKMGTLMIHLCSSPMEQVVRLPGAVSTDVLRFASLWITLTVPKVVGTENEVNSNLPFLLNPSSITKMQSQSLVTDRRLYLIKSHLAANQTWLILKSLPLHL